MCSPCHRLCRTLALLLLATTLVACRRYAESTPVTHLEGDHPANYQRVFDEPVPADVTVVNSIIAAYSFRPGVVTTDDFEFELLVPQPWVEVKAKRFYLRAGDNEFIRKEIASRQEKARPWYGAQKLEQFELYRDITSVGYVHMLVRTEPEADGRRRVFISKH